MGRHSERHIYLKLLKELEDAKNHLDKINMRVHELLDKYDENEAVHINAEHQMWMESDNDNDNSSR